MKKRTMNGLIFVKNAKIKTVFDLIPFWGLSTQEMYQLCGTYHINYTNKDFAY